MTYSRSNPSPRYQELVGYYRQMHEGGDAQRAAEETFDGISLVPHIPTIRSVVAKFGSKSLLDYGSGKAKFYELEQYDGPDGRKVDLRTFWGLDRLHLYDPGYPPLATLPDEVFDGVICTDVMEHIPEADLDWVIDELFGYARHFIYICIATYPAEKLLPDGSNAHVTLKDPRWWIARFDARRKALSAPAHFMLLIFNRPADPKPVAVASYLGR